MAGGTNADFSITASGTRVINDATRANDVGLVILWVNVRLHAKNEHST
jgi:hypothetical protein